MSGTTTAIPRRKSPRPAPKPEPRSRWAHPLLVIATSVLATASLVAPYLRAHLYAAFDSASDMLFVHDNVSGNLTWHGHYSQINLPHPGPFYLWVLSFGYGPLHSLKVGNTPTAGAIVALIVVEVLFVMLAAVCLSKALSTPVAGWALALAIGVSAAGHPQAQVLSFGAIFAPNLVAFVALAAACSCLALARRWRWAPLACVVSGTVLAQLYLELMFVGGIVALLGIYVSVRALRRKDHPRPYVLALLATIPTLVVMAVRLITEGISVVGDYVSSSRAYYKMDEHLNVGWNKGFYSWRLTSPTQAVVFVALALLAAILVAGFSSKWRRLALATLPISLFVALYMTVLVPANNVSPITAVAGFMPLVLSIAITALLTWAPRNLSVISLSVLALTLCFSFVFWPSGASRSPQGVEHATQQLIKAADGRRIELIPAPGMSRALPTPVGDSISPAMLVLLESGANACVVLPFPKSVSNQIPKSYICKGSSKSSLVVAVSPSSAPNLVEGSVLAADPRSVYTALPPGTDATKEARALLEAVR